MTGKIRIDLIFVIGFTLIAITRHAQQIRNSNKTERSMEEPVYYVNRLEGKIAIDGVWDKQVGKMCPC